MRGRKRLAFSSFSFRLGEVLYSGCMHDQSPHSPARSQPFACGSSIVPYSTIVVLFATNEVAVGRWTGEQVFSKIWTNLNSRRPRALLDVSCKHNCPCSEGVVAAVNNVFSPCVLATSLSYNTTEPTPHEHCDIIRTTTNNKTNE